MIALLFTDVEGSTQLAARAPAGYSRAIARHFEILRRHLADHGGREFQENGDGLLLAFLKTDDAAAFAIEAQRSLSIEEWPPESGALKVRMALHTGEAEFRDGQYRGLAMNLAARLLAGTQGGQIVCSEGAVSALGNAPSVPLRRMGVYRLRGFERAEEVSELLWREGLVFRPLRAEHARSHNLPAMQTPIVGRDAERMSLGKLLDPDNTEARLVALTGPGGIGKTRLSIEAARDALGLFDHAVTFVSLAEINEPSRMMDAIRSALRIPFEPHLTPLAQLREEFGSSPALLVLDNMEQLLPEAAAHVQNLLGQIPGLKCLVTSRMILGLPGEREFPVAPLAFHGGGDSSRHLSASGELFVQRASAVRPDFKLTAASRSGIDKLCALLEGIPLAIELAAARMSVLTPQQIFQEIKGRFALLQDQRSEHPERHHSLEAAVSWSFHALPQKVREVLAALSVFRGGFTMDAAIHVAGGGCAEETQAAIQTLRFCSLLIVEDGLESLRFRMLESIRQYASDQLGDSIGDALDRHWRYFSLLAYKLEAQNQEALDQLRLDRLEEEHLNFQQVLANASTPIRRLRLATALHSLWLLRGGAYENRRWFNRVPICSDPREEDVVGRALHAAGLLDLTLGRLWRARVVFERALLFYEKMGEEADAAGALHNLGQIAFRQGAYKVAQRHHLRCAAIYERLGRTHNLAAALTMLGCSYLEAGDLTKARPCLERSVDLLKDSGNRATYAFVLQNRGYLEFVLGNLETACHYYSESLVIHREMQLIAALPGLYVCFAKVADCFGRFELSARLLASSKILISQLKQQPSIRLKASLLELERNARQTKGDAFFDDISHEVERLGRQGIMEISIDLS